MMGNDNERHFIDPPEQIQSLELDTPHLRASHKDLERFYHILRTNLCQVVDIPAGVRVTFPEGTTQQEMYPRGSDARFIIKLPDGLELFLTDHEGSYQLAQVIP